MHPILIRLPDSWPLLGGLSIHTYGLMIALGFMLAMLYVRKVAPREGLDDEKIMDLFFWTMVAGLSGSRIFYIFNSVENFWSDPGVLFRVWEGGLVFQGGIILAVPVMAFLVKRYQLPFFQITDIFAPPLALGHALGRIGCFFAGCCYGAQCDPHFPLALVFPENLDSVAPQGIPLYPTQITESAGEFIIWGILLWYRRGKPFHGAVFLLYLILYSALRSFVEMYRGDTIRGFVIEPYLSNGQFVSLLMILGASFLWVYLKGQKNKERLS